MPFLAILSKQTSVQSITLKYSESGHSQIIDLE